MPLDTALYTIWVPELADSGRIYTTEEALNIKDVAPIKTEKIQTLEIGFKGFLLKEFMLLLITILVFMKIFLVLQQL